METICILFVRVDRTATARNLANLMLATEPSTRKHGTQNDQDPQKPDLDQKIKELIATPFTSFEIDSSRTAGSPRTNTAIQRQDNGNGTPQDVISLSLSIYISFPSCCHFGGSSYSVLAIEKCTAVIFGGAVDFRLRNLLTHS